MGNKKRIADLELTLKPLTVYETDTVSELLDRFTSQPTMRNIYTINVKNELVGIIDRKKIFTLIFAEHLDIPRRISDFYHIISARTAADLCNASVIFVRMEDSIESATKTILQNDLFEIPVLDSKHHPVATLTLWDLLKLEREPDTK